MEYLKGGMGSLRRQGSNRTRVSGLFQTFKPKTPREIYYAYQDEFGFPPKEPKHLVHYAKTKDYILKYKKAEELLNDPPNPPKRQSRTYGHEWKTIDSQADEVEGKEMKEQKNNDINNSNDCCVVVIGITGSGKSSICSLLSGKYVKTSDSSLSDTKETNEFKSKYDTHLRFVDTMGTQDSEGKYTDPQILKKVLQYLHREKINISKVIWCVTGDTNGRLGPFKHQAEFINGLQDGVKKEGKLSVWESVLIIKKEGKPTEKLSGPKHAANLFSPDFYDVDKYDPQRTFGFKCMKWIKKENHELLDDIPKTKYAKYGYFEAETARNIIQEKLDKLPMFEFKFRNQQCIKCGVKGDERYVDAPCHTRMEKYHPDSLSYRHIGKQIYFHEKELKEAVYKYMHKSMSGKSGQLQRKHPGKIVKYHDGVQKTAIVKKVVYSIYNVFEKFYIKEDWKYWNCCGKPVISKREANIEFVNSKTKPNEEFIKLIRTAEYTDGCKTKWICCNEHDSVIQCTNNCTPWTWSCCQEEQESKGCQEILDQAPRFGCCGGGVDSNGCRQKWECGKQKGCQTYYPCCNKVYKFGVNVIECKERCSNCKIIQWGKGPGCIEFGKNQM